MLSLSLPGFGANAIPLGPKKGEAPVAAASTTASTAAKHYADVPTTPPEQEEKEPKTAKDGDDDDENWREQAYNRGRSRSRSRGRSSSPDEVPEPTPAARASGRGRGFGPMGQRGRGGPAGYMQRVGMGAGYPVSLAAMRGGFVGRGGLAYGGMPFLQQWLQTAPSIQPAPQPPNPSQPSHYMPPGPPHARGRF